MSIIRLWGAQLLQLLINFAVHNLIQENAMKRNRGDYRVSREGGCDSIKSIVAVSRQNIIYLISRQRK